ncbi:DNA replication licensing factor Mcm2, putative [Phytophthora infestans T30-4]|uniref:DNA replication licensing factor MCM2 n=1 Tax=Phytophthora infestans (strain T30-4) TaxID=403677 RepID=D0NHV7_PHYIT|nr:DNA replication licensing factor Mcm2, putative [Phytophthora infestans T30-4]EEY58832.1 DNA replication licensing factor Mcm2, putative [Phytophthora infestans T30-4]|eukprot:XP_002901305.1 DNA replication licensing factor Mcm2, putative [Phytophthora infestans T30-4]
MDTPGDASPPASPSNTGSTNLQTPAPVASASPTPGAYNTTASLANGLEDSEADSDNDDSRGRKRRRLRRGDAPSSTPSNAPASPTLSQIANGDDADDGDDDYGEQAEELDEEIVDELDIQERERYYFSEDELDDDADGEDLGENAEMDYRRMETLDRYDTAMLDTRQYDDMDRDTRRAVEDELNRRDARNGRIAQVLQEDQEMEHDDTHRRRFRRRQDGDADLGGTADEGNEDFINLEHFDVPLREWIATETPRNEIKRRFRNFLNSFLDGRGRLVYHEKIVQMAQRNEQSLEIEIGDVIHSMSMVAAWLVEAPKDMLAILDEVAQDVVLALFPYYATIHQQIYVRILDLPGTERLRDLRTAHLNFLIKVSGVVTRRTSVFPQLQLVKVNCPGCGAVLGPFTQQSQQEVKLNACPECQFRGHFPVNSEQTVYRNFQKITLQESPGSVPPGRVPRSKDVVLVGDLIDKARPGDEIAVTGIYTNTPDPTLNLRDGFPVFRTVIEANHVERRADVLGSQLLTAEDKKQILRLAKQPDIAQRIINSIAPSIYGHQQVKTALALALFGGKPKFIKNSRVRGDLNVLMVGDPGTAKSQFLKFAKQTAPRAVYSTGKGASAVGLTAGVSRDPFTKEWVLQGGALVLADKGVCLIDEFDKMNEQDRTSIHEAMEQQSISVSKAGIVTSLQARCSVIAAANPIGGRYNAARTFAENVELTDPILQRFDLLCVLQDKVDPVDDERLADFVVSSHMRSNSKKKRPEDDDEEETADEEDELSAMTQSMQVGDSDASMTLDQELLRKYILYARTFVNPVLASGLDTGKIEAFYAQLRRASQHTGAVPVAVRHLESLFRMAEAHARMHLRDTVGDEDLALAIRVLTESLCDAQKFTFKRQWRRLFRPYLTYRQDNNVLLLHVLHELFKSAHAYQQLRMQTNVQAGQRSHKETALTVLRDDLLSKAKSVGIYDLSEFYESAAFTKAGFHIDEASNSIIKDI